MTKKYIAYYRVSTKRQGESGLGIEGQQAVIEHFTHGDIIASYTDIASGKSIDGRPELERAIQHANKENAYLIVAKADRLSRKVVDAINIFDQLSERLVCCDVPGCDRLLITFMFGMAERELTLIGIRTKAALDAKKKREGKEIINGRPKGYKQNPEVTARIKKAIRNIALKANEKSIKAAKHLHNQGKSLGSIAQELNALGFTTSRGGAFKQGVQVQRLLNY